MFLNVLYELILLMLPFVHVLITENTEKVFLGYLSIPLTFLFLSYWNKKGQIIANPLIEANPRKCYIVV